MVFVAGLVQVVAYQYTKGAVIAGLERAVRAGAVVGAGEAQCRVVLADSLNEVLGGAVGGSLASDCTADGETIRAHASGVVPSWLAGPDLGFDLEVVARRELGP